MAQAPGDFSNLDDSDIASIASDDLHAHRPNRWTGPASTWRALTEDERLLWHAYEKAEDANLGIHLYNVFTLRKRAQDPETRDDVTVQLVSLALFASVRAELTTISQGQWVRGCLDTTENVHGMAAAPGTLARGTLCAPRGGR
jgi:hypothetical protein